MSNVTDTGSGSYPTTKEPVAIWMVACIGLVLSWAALWLIQQQLDAHKQLDFEWVSHNRTRALNHEIQRVLEAATSIRDLFLVSEDIDREDFQVFANAILERSKGIQALMWVPLVSNEDRRRIERITRADIPTFEIVEQVPNYETAPAGQRDVYFPILYATPYQENTTSLGFDLGSDPVLRDVLDRARDSGGMAVSKRITIVESDGNRFGFMAGLPVFRKGVPLDTVTQRREYLLGFAVGLFRVGDLIDTAIAILEPRGVDILVQDESVPEKERFLHSYSSRVSPSSESRVADKEPRGQDMPRVSAPLQVADRKWSVTCIQTPQFRSAEAFKEGPWVVLVAGLLFTLLLAFYLARIKENMAERMRMDGILREREELFRQMTETVDEVFWAADADITGFLYLSPAYEKIWQTPKKGLEGQLALFFAALPPDDQKLLLEVMRRIRRDNIDVEMIHRVVRRDGTTRWVRTHGFPVENEAGEVYRIVGIVEDITEKRLAEEALRESESKLRTVFNQSPDIIMTVDEEGRVLLMNRSIPELPAEEAVGRSSLTLLPSDFREWYVKALKKVFRKGKIKHFEYSTADSKYWAGRIVPTQANGEVTAAMVIATDITERRNMENQALNNARLASIGVLSAGVAHEINNPNNAINFNASLCTRGWRDALPILEKYFEENGDFSLGGLDFPRPGRRFPG